MNLYFIRQFLFFGIINLLVYFYFVIYKYLFIYLIYMYVVYVLYCGRFICLIFYFFRSKNYDLNQLNKFVGIDFSEGM